MDLKHKVIVVTGGARGLGYALCKRFAAAGARGIAIADLDADQASLAARELGGIALRCDVSREDDIQRVVKETEAAFGGIDLFCSNAASTVDDADSRNAVSAADSDFERCWRVHVMAQVYAARALLPTMSARGSGYFLNTVSAAGLLRKVGSAAYCASEHGVLGFAEHLAIKCQYQGIKVSVLWPHAVRTAMIGGSMEKASSPVDEIIAVDALADAVVKGLAEEKFLILPRPQAGR